MKLSPFVLTAVVCLTFSACDNKPAGSSAGGSSSTSNADPKAAFTTALNGLADEMTALQKDASAKNPMAMMKQLPAIMAKVAKVPTDGLPEDVVTAFKKIQKFSSSVVEAMSAIPADLPSDPASVGEYMKAHPEAMKAMMELGPKMNSMKETSDAANKELEAAAKKNGMDLTKFINAGNSSLQ